MKFWHIKSALKWMKYRLKYPIGRIHSHDWSLMDHGHICIAARLLEPKDFEQVCPCNGKCEIELDDICDQCPYMTIVDFDKDIAYNKWISLTFRDHTEYDPFEVADDEGAPLLVNLYQRFNK